VSYVFNVRKECANWIASGDWNVCGTLNFAVGKKPNMRQANWLWSSFWNRLDLICHGKSRGEQRRIPRFVYVHNGGNGDNPHIHFLTSTSTDVREFCILLNAIWAGMHEMTADANQNEILPVFNKRAAAWYLMHEDQGYQMNGFSDQLTHLPPGNQVLRPDALDRMALAVPDDHHIDDATRTYNVQLAKAQLRYAKRVKARNIGPSQTS